MLLSCVVPIFFLCSMTIFRKKFILDSPHLLNLPRGSDPGIQSIIQGVRVYVRTYLFVFFSFCIQSFGYYIENWLSYCQIYVFDLWPCLKIQVGGYLFLHFTPSYLSTGFLYIIAFGKCLDHYSRKPLQLLHYICQSNNVFTCWSWRN